MTVSYVVPVPVQNCISASSELSWSDSKGTTNDNKVVELLIPYGWGIFPARAPGTMSPIAKRNMKTLEKKGRVF